MFSYTGFTQAQVDRLRDEFGIYLVGTGRVCMVLIQVIFNALLRPLRCQVSANQRDFMIKKYLPILITGVSLPNNIVALGFAFIY